MPFTFIFLWTDIAFWGLIIFFLLMIFFRQKKLINEPSVVFKVLQNRIGLACGMILLAYLIVTALDSIHVQIALQHEIKSVLDLILSPLDKPMLRSYTAPFAATYALAPSKFSVGAHIFYLGIFSLFCTLIGVMIVLSWIRYYLKCSWKELYNQILKRNKNSICPICLKTVLLTTASILFIALWMYFLSRYYPIFGTDKIGHDVFYQSIKSIRTALLIGGLTTLFIIPFAILFGTLAGYFRGWVDDVIQYLYMTLSSIPGILLIAATLLMLDLWLNHNGGMDMNMVRRADARLLLLCIILGITSWTSLCRLLRAETLKLRNMAYVEAGIVLGGRPVGIILRHIIPNLMHIVLITFVLDFSGLVLAEAVLSYVGVGVDPSMMSWGNMINRARLELAREPIVWWSLLSAFSFMFILVLSANLFADVVRDAYSPRDRTE